MKSTPSQYRQTGQSLKAAAVFLYLRLFLVLFAFGSMTFLADTSLFAAYNFVHYEIISNAERADEPLRVRMSGRNELRNYRSLRAVGGINFQEEVDLSTFEEVHIDYEETAVDGNRAIITLNDDIFSLPLWDWQLKPIATYAESDYTAVVTLFGDGPSSLFYYYIDYHPALKNTHLGVRLFQADVFLMDTYAFSQAPTVDGEPVYYSGESVEAASDVRLRSSLELKATLTDVDFQSWVLTDVDAEIALEYGESELHVHLQPYYYFWKAEDDPAVSKRTGEPAIRSLPTLTSAIRGMQRLIDEGVPFLAEAVRTTAAYAALFRGVKRAAPASWAAFIGEVEQKIHLEPVETPNQFNKY